MVLIHRCCLYILLALFVLLLLLFVLFFFFFQAEDGIRDHCVTGVQTCALPISRRFAIWPRKNSFLSSLRSLALRWTTSLRRAFEKRSWRRFRNTPRHRSIRSSWTGCASASITSKVIFKTRKRTSVWNSRSARWTGSTTRWGTAFFTWRWLRVSSRRSSKCWASVACRKRKTAGGHALS